MNKLPHFRSRLYQFGICINKHWTCEIKTLGVVCRYEFIVIGESIFGVAEKKYEIDLLDN